jgi:hypothetical protein
MRLAILSVARFEPLRPRLCPHACTSLSTRKLYSDTTEGTDRAIHLEQYDVSLLTTTPATILHAASDLATL